MNYHPKIDQSMNTAAKPVAPLPDDLVAAPGKKNRLWVVLVLALVALGATYWWLPDLPLPSSLTGASEVKTAEAPSQAPAKSTKAPLFRPTDSQWQTLSVETVAERPFRVMLATDGKIAIDEDHTTPVFSPYAGRILKLLAKAGDRIEQGAPLFMVEATDMVQGQNDFITARTALNKAASQLRVAEVILNRHRELLLGNAVSKRELEQAEIGQIAAVNDLKAAEVAFQAARNRLRILGKTDAEIAAFEQGGTRISAETTVMAPLSGTIVQRKVGPGQFVTGASNDPVFLIGDLSKVWLVANVRETDATKVKLDQHIEFTILAQPDKVSIR